MLTQRITVKKILEVSLAEYRQSSSLELKAMFQDYAAGTSVSVPLMLHDERQDDVLDLLTTADS